MELKERGHFLFNQLWETMGLTQGNTGILSKFDETA